jgi:hypothetical protein
MVTQKFTGQKTRPNSSSLDPDKHTKKNWFILLAFEGADDDYKKIVPSFIVQLYLI